MADDEFEKLSKSFDEDFVNVGALSTSIDKKNTSDILDEIDSCFDNEESLTVGKGGKESVNDSTVGDIDDQKDVSDIIDEIDSFLADEDEKVPSPVSPTARHWSELASTLANLPEDANVPDDQARPVEQGELPVEQEEVPVEMVSKFEEIDTSLLDTKEEWEDDWESQRREYTLSDILGELKDSEHLLDESDDEDSLLNIEIETDQSLENDISPKENSIKPALIPPTEKKNKLANLETSVRVTEGNYYKQLEDVWKKYEGQPGVEPMPLRSNMVRPRIFKDNNGRIVGYETLQEYVDNNHPLWGAHREVFRQFLEKERGKDVLVKFVAKEWGEQNVSTARNLTFFSKGGSGGGGKLKEKRVFKESIEDGVVSKKEKPNIKEVKAVLVDMYANSSKNYDVMETEENRCKMYEAQLKLKLEEAEALKSADDEHSFEECDLCGDVCLCVIGRKRALGTEVAPAKISKQQYMDSVVSVSSRNGWSLDRTAEVLYGVEEAYELQSSYTNRPFFSKEQVCELSSLEEVYGMITEMYDSPYKEDNENEMIGNWSKKDLEDV